jgi:hypothetical protein
MQKNMKMFYFKKITRAVPSGILSMLIGLLLIVFPSTGIFADEVSGTDKCAGEALTIQVTNAIQYQFYGAYRLNSDGSYTFIDVGISSVNGATVTIPATPNIAGKYEVYRIDGVPAPPDPPTPIEDKVDGELWIYDYPEIQTYNITGTFTGISSPYTVCDGFGEITITAETWTNPYGSDWDITYQLLKDGDPEQAPQIASSGQTITWSNLSATNPGTVYTVEAYRGLASCTEDMDGTVTMLPGLISNLTKGTCYQTIQDAIDDADEDDEISIPEGSYNETLDVEENIQFSSGGTLTFTSNITVSSGHVLTLNTSVEIQGTLELTGDTDQLIIGDNTLTLNGAWAGLGSIGIDEDSNLELYGTVAALNFDGTAINNLTIDGLNTGLALLGGLTVHGDLTIEDDLDIAGNTLTLLGDFDGLGYLTGDYTSTLEVSGTGGDIASLNADGGFAEFTINRNAVVTLLNFSFIDIDDLYLTQGTLELNESFVTVYNSYTRGTGLLKGDGTASLSFTGSISGELHFTENFEDLGELTIDSDQSMTLSTPLDVALNVRVEGGGSLTLAEDAALTVDGSLDVGASTTLTTNTGALLQVGDYMTTLGAVTLGAGATISGDFTLGAAATFDFSGQALELGAEIIVNAGDAFTTDANS